MYICIYIRGVNGVWVARGQVGAGGALAFVPPGPAPAAPLPPVPPGLHLLKLTGYLSYLS